MKKTNRKYVDSSSFKMALLFTLLLCIAAAILVYFLYDFGRQDFMRETEAAIDVEMNMLSVVQGSKSTSIVDYIEQRMQHDPQIFFRYEDAQGQWLAGYFKTFPRDIQRLAEGILRFDLETPRGEHMFAAKIHTFADGNRMLVARDVHDLLDSDARFRNLIALVMLLMATIVVVSFGISFFVVTRINHIADTAVSIAQTGDLSRRISIQSSWDDLSHLAQTLNYFLSQIESLMMSVREVSNNIAHDLRTPLAALRQHIEGLKTKPYDESTVDVLLQETDRIISIFHSLLRITNIEKGKRDCAFQKVSLDKVLHDVVELFEPLAEEKHIALKLSSSSPVTVMGDRDLLFQLINNLLDNAIKFSPPNSDIYLGTKIVQNEGELVIEDQGPGIKAEDKPRVFQHFFRADSSRSTQGHGLGLSLVKAILDLHRARMTLEDVQPTGLRVRLNFFLTNRLD